MKTKVYKYGKHTYKSYLKPVGKGYEVGFVCGPKSLFVGNFLYAKEAREWFSMMNHEVEKFSKKFWVTGKAPAFNFWNKFVTHNLYKCYYSWLDRKLSKYNKTYKKEFEKDLRKYRQMRKNWKPSEKVTLKKSA